MLSNLRDFVAKTVKDLNTEDPLMIQSYSGYASGDRLYIQGRVLENEGIFLEKDQNRLRTLIDNFKRFESDEIPGARVRVSVRGRTYEATTNEEGYYEIDEAWDTPLVPDTNRWLNIKAELLEADGRVGDRPIVTEDKIFFPAADADCGIITDVDDTVLRTYATSRYRLKMLYASLFLDPYERLPLDEIGTVFSAMEKGGDGKRENPIFYVSNSPWNIYDNIAEFLNFNEFPKGPILLRDIGKQMLKKTIFDETHKMRTIRRIMRTYPDMPFILLGDTAAEDAEFYITLAEENPGRVKAIYIRSHGHEAKAQIVRNLIEERKATNLIVVDSSREILEHAREHGYLR